MYWRDVVTLKAVTEGRDADGYPKEKITETTVFADVSSTKRSEFYAARQAGISLALTVKPAPPTITVKSGSPLRAKSTRSSAHTRRRGNTTSLIAPSLGRRANERKRPFGGYAR